MVLVTFIYLNDMKVLKFETKNPLFTSNSILEQMIPEYMGSSSIDLQKQPTFPDYVGSLFKINNQIFNAFRSIWGQFFRFVCYLCLYNNLNKDLMAGNN